MSSSQNQPVASAAAQNQTTQPAPSQPVAPSQPTPPALPSTPSGTEPDNPTVIDEVIDIITMNK